MMKKNFDFTVKKSKKQLDFILSRNYKIFIKIKNGIYEQIYIDYITNNGNIIIYDNKFNKHCLSHYLTKKRDIKRTSSVLRYIYYETDNDNKIRLYDYLSKTEYI